MLANIDIYFLVYPVRLVLRTTGISPTPPGAIGVLGHPFRTVQPHPAYTELISNGVLPILVKINECCTLEPRATVSKL